MAIQTKVPYRVTEKTLIKWLEQNIGKDEAGNPRFTYAVSLDLPAAFLARRPEFYFNASVRTA